MFAYMTTTDQATNELVDVRVLTLEQVQQTLANLHISRIAQTDACELIVETDGSFRRFFDLVK